MSDPIFIYEEVTVPVNARRNVILKHPAKAAVMVDEIRFFYRHSHGTTVLYNPVDALRVKVKVGNWDATDGDVPVSLLCPLTDSSVAWLNCNAANVGIASYTWKLPKPLYLPRNGQVTFDFGLFDDLAVPAANALIGDMDIGVALVGRVMLPSEPPAITVMMPYATAWLGPTQAKAFGSDLGGAVSGKSGPHDLKNARKQPLNVSHMTVCAMIGAEVAAGRFEGLDALGDLNGGFPLIAPSALGVSNNLYAGDNGIRLQIRDTRGGLVVRDPTPLASVFNMTERAWRMNTVLAPSHYFIVSLSGGWKFIPVDSVVGLRISMGLLGHHEIPVADLGVSL